MKIKYDYLVERISQKIIKNNNELYKKFSDGMRAQSEKFNGDMREQNNKLIYGMRAESEKLNSKLQVHTYWTVGTIIATGVVLAVFLQL